MRRRRLDARLRLEGSDLVEPEPDFQICEGLVLDDDGYPLQRAGLPFPFRDRGVPALGERPIAISIVGRVWWIELGEPFGKRRRDFGDVARVSLDVRIAARVYVALGPVEASRLLEQRDVGGGLEISGLARLYRRIAGLLSDEWQPADLQFRASCDDEIGASRTRDQARLRLDVMGVL